MDNSSFDALVRSLASGANRRQLLKGLLGLGSGAIAGVTWADTEAARRSTPPPRAVRCPGQQTWNETTKTCVCPIDTTICGPDCCPIGQAECCDNACCYGTCYGEELCCPTGRDFCAITGECCPDGWHCRPDYGCLEPGQCHTSEDCIPETCTSVFCTPEHVCSEPVMDCTNGGVEVCCSEGQVCLDDGTCCAPVCDDYDGRADGCGGTCDCPPGQPFINGACLWPSSYCTPWKGDCRPPYVEGLPGTWCMDIGSFAGGACASTEECPTGTVCSHIPSGLPDRPHLCTYPCR